MPFFTSMWFATILGILAALLFPFISWLATGSPIKGLLVGADGKLSTSKCQFWVWTEVVLFSYVFLITAHFQGGIPWPGDAPKLPNNVLLLMGFSVATAAAAKAIATSHPTAPAAAQVATNAVAAAKSAGAPTPVKARPYADLVTDNPSAQTSSLSKIQMLTWNVVAAAVYVVTVFTVREVFFKGTATAYPDVDAALVGLVGIGQGAYLGTKLAARGGTDI